MGEPGAAAMGDSAAGPGWWAFLVFGFADAPGPLSAALNRRGV